MKLVIVPEGVSAEYVSLRFDLHSEDGELIEKLGTLPIEAINLVRLVAHMASTDKYVEVEIRDEDNEVIAQG